MENTSKSEISAFILNITHISAHSDKRYFSNTFKSSFSQLFQFCISYFALGNNWKRRREWRAEMEFFWRFQYLFSDPHISRLFTFKQSLVCNAIYEIQIKKRAAKQIWKCVYFHLKKLTSETLCIFQRNLWDTGFMESWNTSFYWNNSNFLTFSVQK